MTMDGRGRVARIGHWWIEALTDNVGLKLTSIAIAVVLFGAVRGAGTVQRTIEVSLLARLPATAAGRVLVSELPESVRLTVRGAPTLVGGLRSDSLGPVQLDLSDGRRASASIDPSLFLLPAGVTIVSVQPSSVPLSWDALVVRDLAVRARFEGAAVAGARLVGEPHTTPGRIAYAGAAEELNGIEEVATEAISINGLGPGRYDRRVALVLPGPHTRSETTGMVHVLFTVEREVIERRFERVPVTIVGMPRAEARPPAVNVILRGGPERVSEILPSQIVATVDASALAVVHGPVRGSVQLSYVPSECSIVSIEPSEVVVVPLR